MELEHSQLELANTDEIPVFRGTEYEEHVSTWLEVDRSMQGHLWMLGAIAYSLDQKYGDDTTGKFASDVGCSAQRVRQYRKTYRTWQNETRFSSLSFKHHTLAARSKDPQKAIETAEDEKLSTRELETFVKTGELPDREPVIEEEVPDVEQEPGPDDIVRFVRVQKVELVAEYGDGRRYAVNSKEFERAGYKVNIEVLPPERG